MKQSAPSALGLLLAICLVAALLALSAIPTRVDAGDPVEDAQATLARATRNVNETHTAQEQQFNAQRGTATAIRLEQIKTEATANAVRIEQTRAAFQETATVNAVRAEQTRTAATATAQAEATATANAYATATRQANIEATATAQANAMATAQVEATAIANANATATAQAEATATRAAAVIAETNARRDAETRAIIVRVVASAFIVVLAIGLTVALIRVMILRLRERRVLPVFIVETQAPPVETEQAKPDLGAPPEVIEPMIVMDTNAVLATQALLEAQDDFEFANPTG
jgi:hypothetical protein